MAKAGTGVAKVGGSTGEVSIPLRPVEHVYEPIQVAAVGEWGAGKSTLFATFPTPGVVCGFDPSRAKFQPYARTGTLLPETFEDKRGTKWRAVVDAEGKLLWRIEYYHDPKVDAPVAFSRFMDRLTEFAAKEQGKYASFFLDSCSFATLLARKYHQYDLDEESKDPRKWYAGATDLIEEVVCIQLPALECNVGTAFHVSKEKIESEGSMVRAPLAPGRLLNMVGAAWAELWRVYVSEEEKGGVVQKVRRLQTETDNKFAAATQIGVPDGCRADYQQIWKRVMKGRG